MVVQMVVVKANILKHKPVKTLYASEFIHIQNTKYNSAINEKNHTQQSESRFSYGEHDLFSIINQHMFTSPTTMELSILVFGLLKQIQTVGHHKKGLETYFRY